MLKAFGVNFSVARLGLEMQLYRVDKCYNVEIKTKTRISKSQTTFYQNNNLQRKTKTKYIKFILIEENSNRFIKDI